MLSDRNFGEEIVLQEQTILHDRYRLQTKLGQTAGRQTWLAEDLGTAPTETVIVKLLAFADQVNWETLKLFEREASILRQLDHPKIPKYQNYFSIDDRVLWFGLVQDYIPGHSLKDLLAQSQRFSEAQVRNIAIEILEILIYLHELSPPVLHRDLKPSNLMLGEDNHIHLIDFGAVQDRAAVEGATFTVVGTYGYAPFEQFGGRTVPASDLYSLGATLIHLLTGTAPADLPQDHFRIQFQHLVSISPTLVQWINKLTEPDVKHRFLTARQALTALTAENSQLSTRSHQNHHPSQAPQSTITHLRPQDSTVKLQISPTELVVKIPGSPFTVKTLLISIGLMAIGVISMMVGDFSNSFFVILGFILFIISVYKSITVIAVFNHKAFTLQREINLPFYFSVKRLAACKIAAIQHVIHHPTPSLRQVITIQTDEQDIMLPREFNRSESAWIVQEINDWLNVHRS